MIGRSRKREEVLVSSKLMPLGVSSSHSEILFNICHEDVQEVVLFTPTKSLQSHFF